MPKYTLIALGFFFSLWAGGEWKEFVSYDGKFRVSVPGELELRSKQIETAIGEISYHTFVLQPDEDASDNLVYMVSYCDYPKGAVHSDSTDLLSDFFETTVETAVSSVEGELRYTTPIELRDYPGRLWRIDYNDGEAIIKSKCYLVGHRFYSLQAITVKDRSLNPSMDKFFDSFELLEKE